MKLTDHTLTQIVASLRAGEFTSLELTQAYLKRIESLEPRLHAFITTTPELAISQAKAADERLAAWRKSPNEPLPPLNGSS